MTPPEYLVLLSEITDFEGKRPKKAWRLLVDVNLSPPSAPNQTVALLRLTEFFHWIQSGQGITLKLLWHGEKVTLLQLCSSFKTLAYEWSMNGFCKSFCDSANVGAGAKFMFGSGTILTVNPSESWMGKTVCVSFTPVKDGQEDIYPGYEYSKKI